MIIVKKYFGVWRRWKGEPPHLDLRKVQALVAEGVWTAEDCARVHLGIAEPFDMPGDKVAAGNERFEESEGVIRQVFDVIDRPVEPFDAAGYLAALRWYVEQNGTEWNSWIIPTDDRSQLKYASEVLAVQTGARSDGDPWKLPHGFVALTNAQVIEMATAARGHVLACFAAEAAIAARLAGGEAMTEDDIAAAFVVGEPS